MPPTPASRKKSTSSRSTSTRSSTAERKRDSGTPTLESLQNQLCNNCSVGVLYVVRYDPEALHEVGQDLRAENQNPSGGAYEVACNYCGYRASRVLGGNGGEGGEE